MIPEEESSTAPELLSSSLESTHVVYDGVPIDEACRDGACRLKDVAALDWSELGPNWRTP